MSFFIAIVFDQLTFIQYCCNICLYLQMCCLTVLKNTFSAMFGNIFLVMFFVLIRRCKSVRTFLEILFVLIRRCRTGYTMLKKHYSAPVSASSSSLGLYSLGLYSESLKPGPFQAVTVSCQKME